MWSEPRPPRREGGDPSEQSPGGAAGGKKQFELERKRHFPFMGAAVAALVLVVVAALMDPDDVLGQILHVVGSGAFTVLLWGGILYYGFRGRGLSDDRTTLANSLADMLDMGIPLAEAWQQQTYEARERFNSRYTTSMWALERVHRRLAQGSALSEALARERYFPTWWSPVLAAAERTGALSPALRSLARVERRGPLVHPEVLIRTFVVLIMVSVVGSFLSAYIMPTFVSLFETMGDQEAASFIAHLKLLWPVLNLVMLLMLVCVMPAVQRGLGVLVWALGGRHRIRLREQALACESLGVALHLGYSQSEALHLASMVATHRVYRKALQRLTEVSGDTLAGALGRHPDLFDATLRWVLAQSERLSNMPAALREVASWYADEWQRSRARAGAMLGVVLTIGVGLVVGWTALAVLGGIGRVVAMVLARGVMP